MLKDSTPVNNGFQKHVEGSSDSLTNIAPLHLLGQTEEKHENGVGVISKIRTEHLSYISDVYLLLPVFPLYCTFLAGK